MERNGRRVRCLRHACRSKLRKSGSWFLVFTFILVLELLQSSLFGSWTSTEAEAGQLVNEIFDGHDALLTFAHTPLPTV